MRETDKFGFEKLLVHKNETLFAAQEQQKKIFVKTEIFM